MADIRQKRLESLALAREAKAKKKANAKVAPVEKVMTSEEIDKKFPPRSIPDNPNKLMCEFPKEVVEQPQVVEKPQVLEEKIKPVLEENVVVNKKGKVKRPVLAKYKSKDFTFKLMTDNDKVTSMYSNFLNSLYVDDDGEELAEEVRPPVPAPVPSQPMAIPTPLQQIKQNGYNDMVGSWGAPSGRYPNNPADFHNFTNPSINKFNNHPIFS